MKTFDRSFDENEECVLLFDDGSQTLFMFGTKTFFELEKYTFKLRKDYKLITFYLCARSYFDLIERTTDTSNESKEMIDEDKYSGLQSYIESEVNTVLSGETVASSVEPASCTSKDDEIAE